MATAIKRTQITTANSKTTTDFGNLFTDWESELCDNNSLVPRLLPMPKSGEEPGYEATTTTGTKSNAYGTPSVTKIIGLFRAEIRLVYLGPVSE